MPIDPYYFMQGMLNDDISALPATGMFAQQMAPGLGAPGLFDLARSSAYRAPFNPNNRFVDVRPLANFGLSDYGMFGMVGEAAGNYFIQRQLAANGLTSRGNAGSYRQAMDVRDRAQAQAHIVSQLRSFESDSINSVLQGIAAQTGFMGPMGNEQAAATRQMADFAAQYMPTMASMPGFDAISKLLTGRSGSIYPMAPAFADANRFSRDPLTGQRGFSAESNAAMIREVYSNAFRDDSFAVRNGFRAADYGQMYRALSAEGLIGTKGTLRDRTLAAAKEVMQETGIDLPQLVSAGGGGSATTATTPEELTADQLQAIRRTSQVQTKLTKGEAKQVTDQLDSYGESIAAIKEVFLENGQEAPIPALINALKALTNNQMGKFSPGQLTTIVRDMQAMSRVTGQSIDEIFLMRQTAESIAKQYMGNAGQSFVADMTKYGAAAGAAYQEQGAMTGPNALSREQVQAAAIDIAGRAANSEMVNMYSTVGRLTEAAGGFKDNASGRRLKAAYDAASTSQLEYTYTDESGQERTERTPTRIEELAPLFKGATIYNESQFLTGLNQPEANKAFASQKPGLVAGARNAMLPEFRDRVLPAQLAATIASDPRLSFIDTPERQMAVANAVSQTAIRDMTEEDRKNSELVTQRLTETIVKSIASGGGKPLSPEQVESVKAYVGTNYAMLNSAANYVTSTTGGVDALNRLGGKGVQKQEAMISAEAGLSRAFAGVGQINGGDFFSRFSAFLQSSGKNGAAANMDGFAPEVFAIDAELKPKMAAIKDEYEKYRGLQSSLADASSEEDIRRIQKQLAESQARTTGLVNEARSQYLKSGAAYLPSELGMNLPGFGSSPSSNMSAFNVAELEASMRGLPAKQKTSLEEHAASLMSDVAGDTFDQKLATIADPVAREKRRTETLAAAWKQQTLRGQLQTAGALDPSAGDSPIRSREELLRQLPPTSELRNMLAADEAEAKRTNTAVKPWEKTVAEYLEVDAVKTFGLPADELAKKQAQLRQGVDKNVAKTLADEFSSVRDFLARSNNAVANSKNENIDPALKNATSAGVMNADEIKTIADKYFGGDIGRMFATRGQGITDAGRAALDAEWKGMDDAKRAEFIKPLELNGFRFQPGQLPTFEQYQAMPGLNLRRHLGEVRQSISAVNAASGSVPELQEAQSSMFADMTKQVMEFFNKNKQILEQVKSGGTDLDALKDFAAKGNDIPAAVRNFMSLGYGTTREAIDAFIGGGPKAVAADGSMRLEPFKVPASVPASPAAAASAVPPVTTSSNDGSGQSVLKLTGTVNVVGDITGRMSFTELTTSKA